MLDPMGGMMAPVGSVSASAWRTFGVVLVSHGLVILAACFLSWITGWRGGWRLFCMAGLMLIVLVVTTAVKSLKYRGRPVPLGPVVLMMVGYGGAIVLPSVGGSDFLSVLAVVLLTTVLLVIFRRWVIPA